jgi:hypothetical protein
MNKRNVKPAPLDAEQREHHLKEGLCFSCSGKGDHSSECPKRPNRRNNVNAATTDIYPFDLIPQTPSPTPTYASSMRPTRPNPI